MNKKKEKKGTTCLAPLNYDKYFNKFFSNEGISKRFLERHLIKLGKIGFPPNFIKKTCGST
jgi:hypothetical protein